MSEAGERVATSLKGKRTVATLRGSSTSNGALI